MKFKILGRPEFWFKPTTVQLRVLLLLSSLHYDGKCNQASQVGGFIYGWKNTLSMGRTAIKATWDNVDTCAKILEGPLPQRAPKNFVTARAELAIAFHAALRRGNELAHNWKAKENLI